MEIPLLMPRTRLPRNFTDVIYLTNRARMPFEIRRLIKQKGLSFSILPFSTFPDLRQRTHLIGTVIIDAQDLDTMEHQEVGRIIESLEMENIGVVVLTHRVKTRVKSFSLLPTRTSFSMIGSIDAVSIDDLWVQISVNLAYRKKSPGIMSRPMVPANMVDRPGSNRLADQLQMTASLVENLTEQLRLAGLVQRDFLPSQLPQSDHLKWATLFLPAEWVSGDIYDIAYLDPDHISFSIVDAVGHAMPAALLTIFVKQALVTRQTIGGESRILSPAEVMAQLNIRMSREKLSGYQFATCCYCMLNTRTLELTFARAGHPYPVLIRPGQPPLQLEVRGSLLGVFEEAEYLQETIQLKAGDKLVLYSDGAEPFIGAFDDQKGFIFTEAFCEATAMPIVAMMDRFTTLTKTQQLDPRTVDDVTMVGLEIT